MMMKVFVINGEPVGKGRPRFSTYHGYVRAYTPEKTMAYERKVKAAYEQQCDGFSFGRKPLTIEINAMFKIPQSANKKLHAEMATNKVFPTKKCDADNIAKCIADALNGVAYADDAQIINLVVRKMYSEIPRVEVTITEMEG